MIDSIGGAARPDGYRLFNVRFNALSAVYGAFEHRSVVVSVNGSINSEPDWCGPCCLSARKLTFYNDEN